ncbi:MAG: TIGR02281 family clan AA aspartic protease [Caulobacterales bacterium]|nr:TIGR02281 family clan AA aspartic protease [Caulobacterales bacterium]
MGAAMRVRSILAVLCAAGVGGGTAKLVDRLDEAPPARVATSDDGHFWARADVNGAPVRFLVDTGATVVALTAADAARAGFPPEELAFDTRVRTAAGHANAASVTLKRIAIGPIEQRDVRAMVVRDGLDDSLLGMSFLGRLSRIEATPEGLTLSR